MRIIDAHTHIFPEKIADKASEAIGEFYDLPMNSGGGSKTLLEQEWLGHWKDKYQLVIM